MGRDFSIDPVTADLVDSADGWFEETRTAQTAAHMQLTHHYDSWWADPDAGSRLHLARDQGDGPGGAEFMESETRRALGVLVREGRIADLQVRVTRTQPGRLVVEDSWRDLQTGQPIASEIEALAPGGA